jgi:uncharacterized protein
LARSATPSGLDIAVLGAGLAGLTAAFALSRQGHRVTLFEKHARPGFVASAVGIEHGGLVHQVDVPLRVFYPGYYPSLMALYRHIGAASEPISYASSFADDTGRPYFRYRNWLLGERSYSYVLPGDVVGAWGLAALAGALRYHHESKAALKAGRLRGLSLREHMRQAGYAEAFVHGLLVPTVATVCTCPNEVALDFPAELVAQYFARGVASQSVQRAVHGAQDAAQRLLQPVHSFVPGSDVRAVERQRSGVRLHHGDGRVSRHAHVVLATSAQHALSLMGSSASADEMALLGSIAHHPVQVLMHRDAGFMPARRRDWSAIHCRTGAGLRQPQTTIWINAVQPSLRNAPDLFQTVAPASQPAPGTLVSSAWFERPVVSSRSFAALPRLDAWQAQPGRRVWFCGSYARPGIPLLEAAVQSALRVAQCLDAAGFARAFQGAGLDAPTST